MKLSKSGRILLALLVSLGLTLGVTSCSSDYTVAYLFVTGTQYNQVGAFKVANDSGKLTPVQGSPFGSGGSNPLRAMVLSGGRFLYILNNGDPSTPNSSNISVFSIGGNGLLTFQASYFSQGSDPVSMAFDSSGSHLYVIDEYKPDDALNTPQPLCSDLNGGLHQKGDITAFNVDPNTGRLSLITNAQQKDPISGDQLTYFPLGCSPIDARFSGNYLLTIQRGSAAAGDAQTAYAYSQSQSNGQLTITPNGNQQTGAVSLSGIGASSGGGTIYLLDAGPVPGCNGAGSQIDAYTVGANGTLQAITGGSICNDAQAVNPVQAVVDSKGKYLYVANTGLNNGSTSPGSEISGFIINSNQQLTFLADQPFPSGSGPRCILEDPSNQYIYTANFNDGTVTGAILNPQAGDLRPLRSSTSFSTVGNPTWCVASGRTQ